LLDATFSDEGRAGPPPEFPHFTPIRPIFEQPFIQRFLVFGPTCVEIMNFHIHGARLQSIAARIEIFEGFIGGIPPARYEFGPIDRQPLGAFRIDCSWTLTLPMCCRSLP
jgi:hypothetical protein